MANDAPEGALGIGELLKQARRRAGLELGEVEERTKIRTRYLRALEAEEWDALPGEVYVKSFLRTYAQLLGLDAEAILDEYRYGSEGYRPSGLPISEPILRTRRRAEDTGRDWMPGRGLVIGGLIAILLVVLLILGVTGGQEDQHPQASHPQTSADKTSHSPPKHRHEQQPLEPKKLALELRSEGDVPVCLMNGDGQVLLDETMSAGESKSFEAYRYRLRFPAGFDLGQIRVLAGGESIDFGVDPSGPVEYEIGSGGELGEPSDPGGGGC